MLASVVKLRDPKLRRRRKNGVIVLTALPNKTPYQITTPFVPSIVCPVSRCAALLVLLVKRFTPVVKLLDDVLAAFKGG